MDFRYKFIAQATADGCEQVLDRTYKLNNMDEMELDLEMNKFMYLVLIYCFQTGKSKQLVRINYESQNARKVFFEYSDYFYKSPKALLRKTEIHKALATYKFGDDSKSAEHFIIDFTNLFQQLEDLTEDIADWLPETQKLTMLKHAVYTCPDLKRVEIDLQTLGKYVDYDSYKEMLQNAAILYDNQFKVKKVPRRGLNNHVFDYDILTTEQPTHSIPPHEYDLDHEHLSGLYYPEEHHFQVQKHFQQQQPRPYRVPGWLW